MFKYEGKCECCGTQFEYPENIIPLLERYLAKKDYNYVNFDNCLFIHTPNYNKGGIYLSSDASFFVSNLNKVLYFIAEKEKRQAPKVLFDIVYDYVKYYKEQIELFKYFAPNADNNDFLNGEECERQIKHCECELEKELQKQKELDIKIESHRRTMK